MSTLVFDCQTGISGDMTVAALLDLGIAGANENFLRNELRKLNLPNFEVEVLRVDKLGVVATKFNVLTRPETVHRHLEDIDNIVSSSALNEEIKNMAKAIFLNLAKAEAVAHQTTIEDVHFHEVGAIDSIVDVVSTAILINAIKPEKIYCMRLCDGVGRVKMVHGEVDLPVPAVRELLKGVELERLDINKELITPTGAAILKTLALQSMSDKIVLGGIVNGFGAGTRDLNTPNVLRVNFHNS